MKGVLLDTHCWVWSFDGSEQLSGRARSAIAEADAVYVSPISFFEIGQKVRIGKWPEMIGHIPKLHNILQEQGGMLAPFTPDICLSASLREWAHRDPFDRLLAATAEVTRIPLVTRDTAFDGLSGIDIIW